jgi:hypothetical protein
LDGIEVARRALGPGGTAEQYTGFANYLSRIERENANVSLKKLREIAKGLGFATMTAFWQAIDQAGEPAASFALPTPMGEAQNHPSPLQDADHDHRPHAPLDPIDLQSLERVLLGAGGGIIDALRSIEARLGQSQFPPAPARTKTAGRRRAAGARPRKTA